MDLNDIKKHLLATAKAVGYNASPRRSASKLWTFIKEKNKHDKYRKSLIDLATALRFPNGRKSKTHEYEAFLDELIPVVIAETKTHLLNDARSKYQFSGTKQSKTAAQLRAYSWDKISKKHKSINTQVKSSIAQQQVSSDLSEIRDSVKSRLRDKQLAAGHAASFYYAITYDFEMSTLLKMVKRLLTAVFTTTLALFHFSTKLVVRGTIYNTETGERIEGIEVHFPRDSARIIETKDAVVKSVSEFLENISKYDEIEDIYPSTKWKFEKVDAIGIKINKRESGGCQGAKTIKKYGKSCKNPDNKDDLCFWRCLAIALYSATHPAILKKNSAFQREKAKELQALASKRLKRKLPDKVSIEDVALIARALELDIRIYTMNEKCEQTLLWHDKKLAGHAGAQQLDSTREKPIMLHFDQELKHYIIINTLVGYGSSIKCPSCKQTFSGSQSMRSYKNHIRKHERASGAIPTTRSFRSGPLQPKRSQFQRILGFPAQDPLYLAFDYECMLIKANVKDGSQRLTHRHQDIAVVCTIYSDTACNISDFEYVGKDVSTKFVKYLERVAPKLKTIKEKHFYKTYAKQLAKLENIRCICKSTKKQHTGYCNKGYSNEPVSVKQKKCCCKLRILHKKDCTFVADRKILLKECRRIPIIGFNSGRYDMTFVVNAMSKSSLDIRNVVSKGSGYMSLKFGPYDFIDVRNYVPPNIDLKRYAAMWKVADVQKELFPYEWFDSEGKLTHTSLPPIEAFSNKLKNTTSSEEEYQHACDIWKKHKFKTFNDYMMHYCRCDVDLLIKATNNYRLWLWKTSKLELLSFVSLPQMAYCDMLTTYADPVKYPLNYIPNDKVASMINDALFGGNTQVFTRHAQIQSDDELIFSLDENNLYGHSMSQLLPYGDFEHHAMDRRCQEVLKALKRVSSHPRLHKNYSHKALHNKSNRVPKDPYGITGFIRCHLYFTDAQKKRVKHFPPLPSRRSPRDAEMSTYMTRLMAKMEQLNGTGKSKSQKLLYDLDDKNSYSIYSELLKFLLENDLVSIAAVYEVVQMKIGYVMRPYIDEMTRNRQIAEDDIKRAKQSHEAHQLLADAKARKAYYKLKANAVFGKTMQNDEKFTDTTFVRNNTQYWKQVLGRVHVDSTIIDQDLVEVKTKKLKTIIKSPKYLGAAILAYSKMLMLDYIYNCMWHPDSAHSPEDCEILYTDTDSIYIKCTGLEGKTKEDLFKSYLDGLDPQLRELHHAVDGELTVGKMKLEKLIDEAVFLKPKTYALLCNEKETPYNKGVIISQNREAHIFKAYKDVLFQTKSIMCKNTIIQKSTKYDRVGMNTLEVSKVGLDSWYDKRVLLDFKTTEPYGLHSQPSTVPLEQRLWTNMEKRVESFIKLTPTILGCTIKVFMRHIEKKFIVGMCWRNYGVVWNLDHIVPVSFVATPQEDFSKMPKAQQHKIKKGICHFTNIQPLSVRENSSKKDSIDDNTRKMIKEMSK